MEAGASQLTAPQVLDYAGAIGGVAEICLTEWAPHPQPGYSAGLTRAELLARFEGEAGLQAPEPVTPFKERLPWPP
jgi:hypothetical protein